MLEPRQLYRRTFVRPGVFALALGVTAMLLLGAGTNVRAQDSVEFLNGSTINGRMIQIRKVAKEFEFESQFGEKQIKRVYPYSKVHAVTFNGKRFELTKMPTDSLKAGAKSGGSRSNREVEQLIQEQGGQDPPWLASTKMNHPNSLDLDWPLKAAGKWNESKNVGQYLWGRAFPNQSRWKPAVKLIYECMKRHESNRALLQRDQAKLGELYFTLFQDYPRAAYWLQKGNTTATQMTGIYLAECYWRLGSKPMALGKLRGNSLHFGAIKLYGDMGEISKALMLAKQYGETNFFNEAFLRAGDALRGAGRLDEATEFYQMVLDKNEARNPEYLKRYRGLASGAIEAIKLFDSADVAKVADGVYKANSMGYNGQVEVEVKISSRKIEDVKITSHREKQFYAALTDTPKQIIDTQGFQEIDGTSGATITSQAIIHATARAMSQGVK